MRVNRKSCWLIIFFLSAVGLLPVSHAQDRVGRSNGEAEARRIWELAIATKGGRERLNQIQNIHVTSVRRAIRKGSVHEIYGESLNVLPGKIWSYSNDGPGVFGISASMDDYENKVTYVTEGGKKIIGHAMSENDLRSTYYQNNTLFFLMESRWLKPKPSLVIKDTIDSIDVYVLQTDVDGKRVDFILDRQTYLPIEVRTYDAEIDGKMWVHVCKLGNYTRIEGIMVPLSENYENQGRTNLSIQFNVKFNSEVFRQPPSDLRADSWKP